LTFSIIYAIIKKLIGSLEANLNILKKIFWIAISDSETAAKWRRIFFAIYGLGTIVSLTTVMALYQVEISFESFNQALDKIIVLGAAAVAGVAGYRLLKSDSASRRQSNQ